MTGMSHANLPEGEHGEGASISTRLIRGAISGLQLAAAPTFAVMALLTAASGGSAADILCASAQDGAPLTGMTAMYGLMSAFHATPWIRLMEVRLGFGTLEHDDFRFVHILSL